MRQNEKKYVRYQKAFAILLLIMFLFSQAAAYLTFMTKQLHIKEMVEEEIKADSTEKNLVSFDARTIMSSGKFAWVEFGKEFTYQGKMYDLAKVVTVKGKYIFKCIDDKKEHALISSYKKLMEKSSKQDTDSGGLGGFQTFICELYPLFDFSISEPISQNKFSYKNQKIADGHKTVLISPPNS